MNSGKRGWFKSHQLMPFVFGVAVLGVLANSAIETFTHCGYNLEQRKKDDDDKPKPKT